MEKDFIDRGQTAVREAFYRVQNQIAEAAVKAGRDPSEVTLMAVSKTVEPVFINAVIDAGATLIGENKVQEFLEKKDALHLEHCKAHLIGHLQTNKVNKIVGEVDMIQSVDSVRLAKEIGKVAVKKGVTAKVLLEVNIGADDDKFGITPASTPEILTQMSEISGIQVCGLMTVPPFDADMTKTRHFFSNMHALFLDMQGKKMDNISMQILSMGMSGDYEAAVMEGSTLVRVGSAIFGARNYR